MDNHLDAIVAGLFTVLLGVCGVALMRILKGYDEHITSLREWRDDLEERLRHLETWRAVASSRFKISHYDDDDA